MPRRDGNKKFAQLANRGQHMRRRTMRGHRWISKFIKYQWYDRKEGLSGVSVQCS